MSNFVNATQQQIEDLAKCYNDPIYYIENYGWIEVKEQNKIVQANLFPYQKEILGWLVNRESGVVLKSRRVGGSTVVALYLAWLINFRKGINALLISKTQSDAIELLNKVKFAYFNIKRHTHEDFSLAEDASWMLNDVAVNNKQLFATAWKDDAGNILSTSEVRSLTTTSDTGRGMSATFVFIDEMAFIEDQDGVLRSALLTTTRGGHWFAVSTPNGVGNAFYRICMRADRGENKGYNFRRVHWSEAEMTQDMLDSVTEEMTDADIAQEMEMEFISTGDPVFNHTHLTMCYRPPEEFPEVKDEIEKYKNQVRYKDAMYYSGVDTAVGKLSKRDSKRDYHSFTALTKSGVQAYAYHTKEHTLTEWSGNVEQLAGKSIRQEGIVSSLHKQFPGVMHVEVNGPGQAVMINHITPEDGKSIAVQKHTNVKTKGELIRQLILAVESHSIVITDKFTYQCMLVYQRGVTPGTFNAPIGAFDDPVISLALAWDALLRSGAIEFNWGHTTDTLTRGDVSENEVIDKSFNKMGYGPAIISRVSESERLSSYPPENNLLIVDSDLDLGAIKEPEFNG